MGLVDHIDAFAMSIGSLDPDARSKVLIVLDARPEARKRTAEELLADRRSGNVADLVIAIATDPAMDAVATAQLRDVVVQALPEVAARTHKRPASHT
jgi:hypothetical protein